MGDTDLRYYIDQIMLRGAAICGCPLPQTEFFAGFIADELSIFINEFGYGEFTYEEILLALRLNSKGGLSTPSGINITQVEFSGTCFNVDYMAKVLSNYLSLRKFLDGRFKNEIDEN